MLKRLLQYATGFSQQQEAKCAACGELYSEAKPFIEGRMGTLICHRCLADKQHQFLARASSERACSASALGGTAPLLQDDNPYSPPAIATEIENTCAICGLTRSVGDLIEFASNLLICHGCVEDSMRLIDGNRMREPSVEE